jgi:phosphatidylserine decarboxylase
MIAKEGRIILIPLFLVTFTLGIFAHGWESTPLSILYGVLGFFFLFSLNFFRDPQRVIPMDEKLIISPADGKVVRVDDIHDPNVGESAKIVSIFLNVFNVHANRVPIEGIVESVERKSGKFLAAFDHILAKGCPSRTLKNLDFRSTPSLIIVVFDTNSPITHFI